MRYDFQCANGHTFERVLPVVEVDSPQTCECGAAARVVVLTSPAMHGFEQGSAAVDDAIYHAHNVTARDVATVNGGKIAARPVAEHMQCQCGNCGSHRRRNAVTGVAGPGKDVN